MQEIKSLLNKVLQGDEAAFNQFCLDRQNHEIVSPFLGALKYFHVQAGNMPEKLDKCYPELLIELAYYLRDIYAALEYDQSVVSFVNCVKRAAKNNDGAKAALFILLSEHKSILTSAELQALIEQVKSIEQAANLNKHQLYLLGSFCFFDDVNSVKAPKYIEAAATMGHVFAMNDLGAMHEESRVVKELSNEMCNKEAFAWYKKAAASGCVVAMNNLGKMFAQGKMGKGLSEEEQNQEAFAWFRKAAAIEYIPAMTNLGYMYLRNKAGKDLSEEARNKEAFDWFKKAADRGHVDAMYNLGVMYEQGRVYKEMTEESRLKLAKEYYQKALEKAPLNIKERINGAIQRVAQKLEQLRRSNSLQAITPSAAQEQILEPSASLQPPVIASVAEIPLNELFMLRQKIQQLEQTVMYQQEQLKSRDRIIQLLTERLQRSASSNTQTFFQPHVTSAVGASEAARNHAFDTEHDEFSELAELHSQTARAKPNQGP